MLAVCLRANGEIQMMSQKIAFFVEKLSRVPVGAAFMNDFRFRPP
jgi:hypothetical protein